MKGFLLKKIQFSVSHKINGRNVKRTNPKTIETKAIFLCNDIFRKGGKINNAMGSIADNRVEAIIPHTIAVIIKFLSRENFFR
jgi:hypothetical protein